MDIRNRDKQYQFFQFFLLLFISFIISTKIVLADTLDAEQIKALLEETRALRQEVTQLKKQLAAHTREHKVQPLKRKKSVNQTRLYQKSQKKSVHSKAQVKITKPNTTKVSTTQSKTGKLSKYLATLGGYTPIISPYLNQPPAYDGSDLLTNLLEQNTDLLVLQYREEIDNAFSEQKMSEYYLILSGALGTQINLTRPYVRPSISDIDLTVANITALAGIGNWVTGFMSFDYDSTPLNGLNPPQFGPRVGNSRVYVDQGFVTLGNVKKADWYVSIGQMYLPFGQYNSYLINSPLTSSLFTTSERPLLLGYSHSMNTTEFDAAVYGYQGDTITSIDSNYINEWGASLAYLVKKTKWNGQIGVGYISNIADSEGIQLNGQLSQACEVFGGFAFPCRNANVLVHRVPGFDVYGTLTIGNYSLVSEYITATRAFSTIDMTFNKKGARPQAFDLEGAYAFSFFKKPSSISLSYAFTKEALALLLPAKQYTITFTTSLWRKTTQSIGFQHNINYGSFSTATGQMLPIFFPVDRINLGKSSNTVTIAVNAFF